MMFLFMHSGDCGKGMVGSFMCDLNGVWSSDFLSEDGSGKTFILNVVSALMPTESDTGKRNFRHGKAG